ncbi:MAG TPA: hypothetical protein VFS20_02175 [Longimicrobium sp.]|nr:hypothetical protein [Longimicrobium sp.]
MTRSFVRHALAALAAVAVAACSTVTYAFDLKLDITPDKPEYTSGSPVVLTVRNLGDDVVAYSFCTWAVQRQTVSGWTTVDTESVACPMAIFTIDPGESVTGTVQLPDGIPSGRYRVFLPGIGEPASDQVIDARSQEEKTSKPFQVKALVAVPAS